MMTAHRILKSEVFVMKRKVYWSVERSVWGAIKPVHYYFREKENAEMLAHENEYCGCPEKHTASLNVYEQIIFED